MDQTVTFLTMSSSAALISPRFALFTRVTGNGSVASDPLSCAADPVLSSMDDAATFVDAVVVSTGGTGTLADFFAMLRGLDDG